MIVTMKNASGGKYGGNLEQFQLIGSKMTTGIDHVPSMNQRFKNAQSYNLSGQPVDFDTYKGIVVRGGKKYLK